MLIHQLYCISSPSVRVCRQTQVISMDIICRVLTTSENKFEQRHKILKWMTNDHTESVEIDVHVDESV